MSEKYKHIKRVRNTNILFVNNDRYDSEVWFDGKTYSVVINKNGKPTLELKEEN